ncbi:Netrin receptor unc5d, partial [Goodea atripinnis]
RKLLHDAKPQGVERTSDVALYSGLAAGVVTVVLLIVAVTLYRRSQSEYGVDVIDSSALTGGFQSFSFKTSRQGKPVTESHRDKSVTTNHAPTRLPLSDAVV